MAVTVPSGFPLANNATGLSSLTISPANVGDVIMVSVKVSSSTVYATALSGGGVTTWHASGSDDVDSTDGINVACFYGKVTTTGSSSVSVTFSASNTFSTEIAAIEFAAGPGYVWTVNAGSVNLATGVSGSVPYSPISSTTAPTGAIQVLFSYARASAGAMTPGSTTGFSYYTTPSSNGVAYNTALANSTGYTPTGNNATTSNVFSVSRVLTATPQPITQANTFPVDAESTGLSSLTINPQAVGDIVILASNLHSQTITITGVSCAKTGAWNLAYRFVDGVNGVITEELWYATATSTGSTTVNVTWSASVGSLTPELVCDSYTTSLSGLSGTWGLVTQGGLAHSSTTTINFPSLTAGASTNQLYWGYSEETNAGAPGGSAGFTYFDSSHSNLYCANPTVAPSTAYAPTGNMTSGNTTAIAAIFSITNSYFGTAAYSVGASLVATGTPALTNATSISSLAALAMTVVPALNPVINLTPTATLTAINAPQMNGAASLASSALLTAIGQQGVVQSALFTASSTISATGNESVSQAGLFSATALLSAISGSTIASGPATLTAQADLSVLSLPQTLQSISPTASAALSFIYQGSILASASFGSSADLVITGIRNFSGSPYPVAGALLNIYAVSPGAQRLLVLNANALLTAMGVAVITPKTVSTYPAYWIYPGGSVYPANVDYEVITGNRDIILEIRIGQDRWSIRVERDEDSLLVY